MDRKSLFNMLGIIIILISIFILIFGHEVEENSKITAFNFSDDDLSFSTTGDTRLENEYKSAKISYIHLDNDFKKTNESLSYSVNGKVSTVSHQIISVYNRTNSNHVNVEFEIFRVIEKNTNSQIDIYNLLINCKNGKIYRIMMYGNNSDNEIENTANQVFETLKLKE